VKPIKVKMSEANKGKKYLPDTLIKMSESFDNTLIRYKEINNKPIDLLYLPLNPLTTI
jgi:hypothetical protein